MPPKVTILGPFPPPLHGFSQANLAMRSRFLEAGFAVATIDTASSGDFLSRIRARCRTMMALVAALAGARSHLYLPVSGGSGQGADLFAVLMARLFGSPITLHHHSFAYLNRFRPPAAALFHAAGPSALHIVLAESMKDALIQRYPSVSRVSILSNAALTAAQTSDEKRHGRPFTIGFLSNVTREKGIDRFAAIHERLLACDRGVAAMIAGPVAEPEARHLIDRAVRNGARYLGAVSAEARAAFFSNVDVLVFPTRYVNEAEPFVILEALASGTPVIASSRGCIASMIDDGCGLLLDADASDIEPAITRLLLWAAEPAALETVRRSAALRFSEIKGRADLALADLLAGLLKAGA